MGNTQGFKADITVKITKHIKETINKDGTIIKREEEDSASGIERPQR
jgi:hypothetical protein